MDVDVGYAHLFVQDPRVEVIDKQGHELRGNFDASLDIVSAAVTFRWGGPRETTPVSGKDVLSYKNRTPYGVPPGTDCKFSGIARLDSVGAARSGGLG
jgi:hypothetical protein